jgi:hypothetical protein
VNVGATLVASLLVTLAKPSTWALGLTTFLVRGGIVLVIAPIVVLPSSVGLGNVLAPTITVLAFVGISPEVARLIGGIGAVTIAWLLIGGLFAALVELDAMATVLAEADERPAASRVRTRIGGRERAVRILLARLLAHVPTSLALAWGGSRVVAVAYTELTLPSDVVTPITLRVVRGAADGVIAIVVAWLIGEAIGGLAARRIGIDGAGALAGVRYAAARVIRHPIRVLALAFVPLAALAAVGVLFALASRLAWDAVRGVLAEPGPSPSRVGTIAIFIGLWGAGLVLIALVSAWRAAVWTVEAGGTFGGVTNSREGGWDDGGGSATLPNPRPRGADPDPR